MVTQWGEHVGLTINAWVVVANDGPADCGYHARSRTTAGSTLFRRVQQGRLSACVLEKSSPPNCCPGCSVGVAQRVVRDCGQLSLEPAANEQQQPQPQPQQLQLQQGQAEQHVDEP